MTTDNFCFYLQNRLIQTSQTGRQWYSDTSPFSIPWLKHFQPLCQSIPLPHPPLGNPCQFKPVVFILNGIDWNENVSRQKNLNLWLMEKWLKPSERLRSNFQKPRSSFSKTIYELLTVIIRRGGILFSEWFRLISTSFQLLLHLQSKMFVRLS